MVKIKNTYKNKRILMIKLTFSVSNVVLLEGQNLNLCLIFDSKHIFPSIYDEIPIDAKATPYDILWVLYGKANAGKKESSGYMKHGWI